MSALQTIEPREADRRFLVMSLDICIGHSLELFELMQRYIAPRGHSYLGFEAAKIKFRNLRSALIGCTDAPYRQRINACSQEMRQELAMIAGTLRVGFIENTAPAVLIRRKAELVGALTRFAIKLHVAGQRANIDFSESLVALRKMVAVLTPVPDPCSLKVISTNSSACHAEAAGPLNASHRDFATQEITTWEVNVSAVRIANKPLCDYGAEATDLVMGAEAIPLDIVMALQAREDSDDAAPNNVL